jgi:hypothetical protein
MKKDILVFKKSSTLIKILKIMHLHRRRQKMKDFRNLPEKKSCRKKQKSKKIFTNLKDVKIHDYKIYIKTTDLEIIKIIRSRQFF